MKKGVSVNLPNQADMKGGRVVEHHESVGSDVQQGAVVLTVQIHDRTLQFKSPARGKLVSIASLATLPEPGDLLFRLMVEQKSESTNEENVFNTTSSSSASTTESYQEAPKSVSDSQWGNSMGPIRSGLGGLMWLMFGSVLAGAYIVATGGDSPIGDWLL